MFRRMFSKGAEKEIGEVRDGNDAQRCMMEVEGFFGMASNTIHPFPERMSALNKAARMGNKLKNYVDKLPAADPVKEIWNEQSNEVQRQLQVLTERLCSNAPPHQTIPQAEPPPEEKEHPAGGFDLFSGLTVENIVDPPKNEPPPQTQPPDAPEDVSDTGVRLPLDENLFSDLLASETSTGATASTNEPTTQDTARDETRQSKQMDTATQPLSTGAKSRVTKKKKIQVGYGRTSDGSATQPAPKDQPLVEVATPAAAGEIAEHHFALDAIQLQESIDGTAAVHLEIQDTSSLPDTAVSTGEVSSTEKPEKWMTQAENLSKDTERVIEELTSATTEADTALLTAIGGFTLKQDDEIEKAKNTEDAILHSIKTENSLLSKMVGRLTTATEGIAEIVRNHQQQLQSTKENLRQEIATLEGAVTEDGDAVKILSSDVEHRATKLESAKAEAETRHQQYIKEKENARSDLVHQRDALAEEIERLRALLKEKETDLENMDEEINKISTDLNNTKEDFPEDSDLERETIKLTELQSGLEKKKERLEEKKTEIDVLTHESEADMAALESMQNTLRDRLKEVEKKAGGIKGVEALWSEVHEGLRNASQKLITTENDRELSTTKGVELKTLKQEIDDVIPLMQTEIQSKEDALQQMLQSKKRALEAKEYNEASQLAEDMRQVTTELSELETHRLSSCQESEALEQELVLIESSIPDADTLTDLKTEVTQWQTKRLCLLKEFYRRLFPDVPPPHDLLEAVAELPEDVCKDIGDRFDSFM